jgi:oligosaccharide repeat unit polymerase
VGIALVGPSIVFGRYSDVWRHRSQGVDFRLLIVGMMFSRAATLAIVASHTHRLRWLTWGAITYTLGLLVLFAQLGDRSALVSFALATGWVVSQRVRRIPGVVVAAAACAGFTLLPIIGEYRETRSVESREPSDVFSTFFRQSGATIQTFAYTLDYVPQEREYSYGMTYVRALGSLVPNLGVETGKDFLPAGEEYDPGYWLALTIAPHQITDKGAFGYSLGAELYFNFGVPGVLLGAILFGYLTAGVRNGARRSSMSLLWSALFFASGGIVVRNVMSYPLMVAVWPFAAVVMLQAVLGDVLALLRSSLGDRRGVTSG